ncbi:MAG: hypothetical protein R3B40_32365 [Polyangiales bacterium]|nr:hypothetical protein [Myxococcales bacterium]MCB9661218.1 hypothetical protein [Sandaracinaceae bacterium]
MRAWAWLALLVCGLCGGQRARADERDLYLLETPATYTDVADAADGRDPFDLNVRVLFRRLQDRADVRRERPSSTGRTELERVGAYRMVRHELQLGLDIGLFRDLELSVDLPLVLSDDRRLGLVDGALPAGLVQASPLVSPTRSGIDMLLLSVGWAPLNQYRDPHSPTWVFRLSSRIAVGEVRHPCVAGQSDCGVSDGTHALTFETRMSHRFRYAEPYGGAGFTAQFRGRAAGAFAPGGDLPGYRHVNPPLIGEFVAGMALIPWEHRGKWQRLTLDVRLNAQWVAQGRDYSPLFDALGTSMDPTLANPSCEGAPADALDCTGDPGGLRLVPFTGLTDVQAHGRLGGRVALELQAARFVRFGFGGAFFYTTPHQITGTDRCNGDAAPRDASDPRIAGCARGIVDPHYRVVLDTPGQRFSLGGQLRIDLFASMRAQF